jgi:hypothetical protein
MTKNTRRLRKKERQKILAHYVDTGQFDRIPPQNRKKDLCIKAMQQGVVPLSWVPKKYRTLDMCMAAIDNVVVAGNFRFLLDSVPTKFRLQCEAYGRVKGLKIVDIKYTTNGRW